MDLRWIGADEFNEISFCCKQNLRKFGKETLGNWHFEKWRFQLDRKSSSSALWGSHYSSVCWKIINQVCCRKLSKSRIRTNFGKHFLSRLETSHQGLFAWSSCAQSKSLTFFVLVSCSFLLKIKLGQATIDRPKKGLGAGKNECRSKICSSQKGKRKKDRMSFSTLSVSLRRVNEVNAETGTWTLFICDA